MYIITWITNPNILILIPRSEVQETTSFKIIKYTEIICCLFSLIYAMIGLVRYSPYRPPLSVINISIIKQTIHQYLKQTYLR
jgi:hypothetical protein